MANPEIPFTNWSGMGPPPTGAIGSLQSLQILQSLGNPAAGICKSDIMGMIGGGFVGWWIANKFPATVVKYIGVIVGAELGILLVRLFKNGGGV